MTLGTYTRNGMFTFNHSARSDWDAFVWLHLISWFVQQCVPSYFCRLAEEDW
jgi:hypothetical protein